MKTIRLLTFVILIPLVLNVRVSPLSAQVPNTPKIIFGSARDGNREIYIMNPDGTQQINLTHHKADDVSATWSPTGEQILFASDRDRFPGSWDLYLMDPDGGNVQQVFEKSAPRRHPDWSPDGSKIAYTRIDGGVGYVYIATRDGKNEKRMAIGGSPAWSPDGSEIAFVVRVAPDRLQIYILNLQTHKQKAFFPRDAISTAREPNWFPTGNKLAFMWHTKKGPNAKGTIYTMNRDGTDLQKIVNAPGLGAAAPVWSPRGDALLYRRRLDHTQIYKIALNGALPEQLTDLGIWNVPGDWFDPDYALPVSPRPELLTTTWGEVKKR